MENKNIKFIILTVCILIVGIATAFFAGKPQRQWVASQYGTTSDDTVKLDADTEVKIEFTIRKDNFQGIAIRFANQGEYHDEILKCAMYDEETGELLAEYETEMRREIYNSNTFLPLFCQNAGNRRVSVVFSGENLTKNILFYTSNHWGEESKLYVNGKLQESVLVFSDYFSQYNQYNVKAILEGILIIILLIFVYTWDISNICIGKEGELAHKAKIGERVFTYCRQHAKILVFMLLVFLNVSLGIFVYACYVDETLNEKLEADILKPQKNAETLRLDADVGNMTQTFRVKEPGLSTISYQINVKECSARAGLRISIYYGKQDVLLERQTVYLKDFATGDTESLEIVLDNEFAGSKRKKMKIVMEPLDFGDTQVEFLTSRKTGIAECLVDGTTQRVTPAVKAIYRDRDFLKLLYPVFAVCLLAVFCFVYYAFVFAGWRVEQVFVPLVILIGSLYMFIIPVYTVPDEYTHIDTAYEIANRILGIEASENPGYMYKRACDIETNMASASKAGIASYRRIYTSLFERAEDTALTECCGKSAIANAGILYYLPSAAGITIARLLHWGTFPMLMLGRFCNLLVFALLGYIALRKIPWGKNILCVIMTLSITLQEAASFSYDGMINGIAFVYLAYCFALIDETKVIRRRDVLVLLFLLMQMASVKGGVYLPLCFLVFLIPYERNWRVKGNFRYYVGMAGFILLCFAKNNMAAVLNRLQTAQGAMVNGFTGKELYTFNYLFHHPLKLISMYVNTLFVEGDDYVQGVLGGELGMHQLYLPWMSLFVVAFILFFLCRDKRNNIVLKKKLSRIWIGLMALFSVLLVCLSMLVSFTTMEYHFIEGVQGRYFIPLLLLPCVLLGIGKRNRMSVDVNKCFVIYYVNHIIMFYYIVMSLLGA
ncbi:MAG: DUF2142 domain-containing protein [Bacteroidales bacterium]|nr:DUF2142 domain-containing protein [Clostridium sp.]MCM1202929.1 DUF2142 domain-containing protein [Bacteroidales bacterium]